MCKKAHAYKHMAAYERYGVLICHSLSNNTIVYDRVSQCSNQSFCKTCIHIDCLHTCALFCINFYFNWTTFPLSIFLDGLLFYVMLIPVCFQLIFADYPHRLSC